MGGKSFVSATAVCCYPVVANLCNQVTSDTQTSRGEAGYGATNQVPSYNAPSSQARSSTFLKEGKSKLKYYTQFNGINFFNQIPLLTGDETKTLRELNEKLKTTKACNSIRAKHREGKNLIKGMIDCNLI
ncbi:CLUMA_CG001730, isoform A [Clunio marinus]|uniref:CLUMA_CG001730, isoform A n=1 Tax=Clunio marinus TaxID=568069 RepID=A0A1J1HIR7_9DIPT|nr:CLUMA_CG001730, isoform A [Clunio marinus]